MSGSTTQFPTGLGNLTPARDSVVLVDNGTANGKVPISAILGLATFGDLQNQLMQANDIIEPVAANTTSYTFTASDKNKTKDFQNTAACVVNLPAGMVVGTYFSWIQGAAGILTFQGAAGAGQTIIEPDNAFRSGGKVGASGSLLLFRANTWLLSGYTQA